jgi:hypothetical protein
VFENGTCDGDGDDGDDDGDSHFRDGDDGDDAFPEIGGGDVRSENGSHEHLQSRSVRGV